MAQILSLGQDVPTLQRLVCSEGDDWNLPNTPLPSLFPALTCLEACSGYGNCQNLLDMCTHSTRLRDICLDNYGVTMEKKLDPASFRHYPVLERLVLVDCKVITSLCALENMLKYLPPTLRELKTNIKESVLKNPKVALLFAQRLPKLQTLCCSHTKLMAHMCFAPSWFHPTIDFKKPSVVW